MGHLRATDHDRSLDLTLFCGRLARQLESEGWEHPHVAAAVIAARGAAAMKPDEFATAHGIVSAHLAVAEAGELAWDKLSDAISTALHATPGLSLQATRSVDDGESHR